jgi:hypothetical protein
MIRMNLHTWNNFISWLLELRFICSSFLPFVSPVGGIGKVEKHDLSLGLSSQDPCFLATAKDDDDDDDI